MTLDELGQTVINLKNSGKWKVKASNNNERVVLLKRGLYFRLKVFSSNSFCPITALAFEKTNKYYYSSSWSIAAAQLGIRIPEAQQIVNWTDGGQLKYWLIEHGVKL